MWSALRRGAGVACFRLAYTPVEYRKLDENRIEHPIVRDPNSGIDRVFKIFDRDENGTISPEASYLSIFTFTGALFGGIRGGLLQSRMTNLRFRESNEATLYYSNYAAKKDLLDKTTLAFGKGVAKYGVRYAIFCSSFAGLSTIISSYRGKFGVIEYSTAGLITGAIYKFSLGPRGMISGGFFGGMLGSLAGLMIYGMAKVSGITMNDAYQVCYEYFKIKDKNFHHAKIYVDKPDIILDKYHQDGVVSGDTELSLFEDIQSSELKYNKKPIPKLENESKHSVISNSEKK